MMKLYFFEVISVILLIAGCARNNDSYYDDSAYDYAVPAGSRVWLMADKGVVSDSGGRISIWRDQSGNGNDAVQSLSPAMPELAANMAHGKSAVYFNGDYYMTITGDPVFKHNDGARFAAFIVFRMEEEGTFQGIFSIVRDDNIKPFILHNMAQALRLSVLVTPSDTDSNYIIADYSLKKFSVVSCLYMAGGSVDLLSLKINGRVQSVMSRSMTSTQSSYVFIGKSPRNTSSPYMQGYISELIMYDRGLTDIEVKQAECYLWHKYNISCEGCNE